MATMSVEAGSAKPRVIPLELMADLQRFAGRRWSGEVTLHWHEGRITAATILERRRFTAVREQTMSDP